MEGPEVKKKASVKNSNILTLSIAQIVVWDFEILESAQLFEKEFIYSGITCRK